MVPKVNEGRQRLLNLTWWPLVKGESVSCSVSHVQLFVTPWTTAHQAPLSTEFSRQEYWSGLPCPFLGYLPDPGIEPRSPTLQADCLPSEPPGQKVGSIKISVWYWQCRKELRRRKEKVEPLNKSVGEKIWKSHEFLTSGQLQRAAWG